MDDFISTECSVQTCQESMTVTILKGTSSIHQVNITNQTNAYVNTDLKVSEDTADQYACVVQLPDGNSFIQRFNITGTYETLCVYIYMSL